MGLNENTLNEIERERASYLLCLDDMCYEILCETLVVGNKSAMTQDTHIEVFGEIKFPNRNIHHVRPATLEDEIAESSY
ncbi:MAG: hypothetical protein WC556_05635 [Candidatus Methanoperedens sp.]